jgi:hypothetical protein
MDATAPQQLPDKAAAVAEKKRLKNKSKKERQKAKKAAQRESGSGAVKAEAGAAAEVPGQEAEKLKQLAVKVNVVPYLLARPEQVVDGGVAVEGGVEGGDAVVAPAAGTEKKNTKKSQKKPSPAGAENDADPVAEPAGGDGTGGEGQATPAERGPPAVPLARPKSALRRTDPNTTMPVSSGKAAGIKFAPREELQEVFHIEATGNCQPTPPRGGAAARREQSAGAALMQDQEVVALMSQPGAGQASRGGCMPPVRAVNHCTCEQYAGRAA